MTAATAAVHSRASIDVRTVVLPRASWETARSAEGQLAWLPQKGTWFGHIIRTARDLIILPMIGCPACGGALFLSHTLETAKILSKLTGKPVPVAHQIDHLGKVSPDLLCTRGGCDFHRRAYLDRWNKTKALYAVAYVNRDAGEHGAIEIAYSHAIDGREALMHLGAGNFRIISTGPAIGFYVDEKTGRMTAD